jgi:hypothetical protein
VIALWSLVTLFKLSWKLNASEIEVTNFGMLSGIVTQGATPAFHNHVCDDDSLLQQSAAKVPLHDCSLFRCRNSHTPNFDFDHFSSSWPEPKLAKRESG